MNFSFRYPTTRSTIPRLTGTPHENRLERRYGLGHPHFITCSCYRRLPFFTSERRRDIFLKILREVRDRYDLALLGYVVMPEHIHLLISEPNVGTPSTVMQVLKPKHNSGRSCFHGTTPRLCQDTLLVCDVVAFSFFPVRVFCFFLDQGSPRESSGGILGSTNHLSGLRTTDHDSFFRHRDPSREQAAQSA
ncbi:MAG TPA: transposase [Candidatus Acidoferrales bacterium]|nr:transposase [Candidatus Acidoferrales bacterium]